MHYFPTRAAFLIEAVTHLALQLADEALEKIDLAAVWASLESVAALPT